MTNQKMLILGLGNPILGDDGVGWKVADFVKKKLAEGIAPLNLDVEVDCLAVGGLSLMERMIGYDRVILVDAMNTGQNPVGTLACAALDELPNREMGHLSSAHDTSLAQALEIGRGLGALLPGEIEVVSIEAQRVFDFSEELSPPVAGAVPQATEAIIRQVLRRNSHDFTGTA